MPGARAIGRWLLLPWHAAAMLSAAKSFRDNPVIGSPALNARGLHLARRRWAARMSARRRRALGHALPAADRAALDRDGFLVRPDHLSPAHFAALRAEIMGLNAAAREAAIGDTLTRLIPLDRRTLAAMPATRALVEAPAFRAALDYAGSFRRRPRLYVQTLFTRWCEGAPDIQSFYHADTFHATVKAWFYLQDVAADAAALTYVPGSHRATQRRLAWERRVSRTARDAGDRLTAEGSFRFTAEEIARLGYPAPRALTAAANTLIVADTSGIHRRAPTEQATVRVAIWAYARGNPFLPWAGGDLLGLSPLHDRVLRLYWTLADRLRRGRPLSLGWAWVGHRTPLAEP